MHPNSPSDPAPQFVAGHGLQIAYTDEGDGPVAVALHGLPGALRDFRWLAPAVPSLRLVRIDFPGYGSSTRSGLEATTVAQRADAVLRVLDALSIDDFSFITHSAGSMVAAEIACQLPKRVRHCAFICSPGLEPHPPVKWVRRAARPIGTPLGRAIVEPVQWALYRLSGFGWLDRRGRVLTTLDAAAQDFDRHAENLRGMRQPTLLAWSTDDPIVPLHIARRLAEVAPMGPRLEFADGGHIIQKTYANEIGAAIEELFR